MKDEIQDSKRSVLISARSPIFVLSDLAPIRWARPQRQFRLGSDILRRKIEPSLLPTDVGKFVAIDVDHGDFEVNEDDFAAVERLCARLPDAAIFLGRVGQPTTYKARPVTDRAVPELNMELAGARDAEIEADVNAILQSRREFEEGKGVDVWNAVSLLHENSG